jgi:hypothetical protein
MGLRLTLARLQGLAVHCLFRHSLQRALLLLLLWLQLHYNFLLWLLLL